VAGSFGVPFSLDADSTRVFMLLALAGLGRLVKVKSVGAAVEANNKPVANIPAKNASICLSQTSGDITILL